MTTTPNNQTKPLPPAQVQCETIDGLLTARDVAGMMGCSTQTIRLWRKHHGLPFVLIPGSDRNVIRFRRHRVQQWAKRVGKTLR